MGRLTKDRLQQFQPTQHATSEVKHKAIKSSSNSYPCDALVYTQVGQQYLWSGLHFPVIVLWREIDEMGYAGATNRWNQLQSF